MAKYIVQGGKPLFGEVEISGAKNAAVAIIPAALLVDGVCRIENIPQISDVTLCLRILEELGNNSVFDGTGRIAQEGNTELIIDEMILALEHMARRKVGALIVIENKIRLNDVIATGTHVDGLISQPLIENIFEPNTPLHDGAVVIRGDRVIAAACLLRLSDTTGVGRDLGTRHRAGLGVSEISDAKVFIVSEETGIISMAEGGRLVRHLDEASLRQILHGIYDTQDSDARMPLLHFRQRRKSAHDEQQADKKA